MSDPTPPTRVLFVCLGNICRSPLAEGVFCHLLAESGLEGEVEVDSAGTGGWHVGEPADPRSQEVASRHGITLESRGRQVREDDFHEFDLVIAMDRSNLSELQELQDRSGGQAELRLIREFDDEAGDDLDVPDPYYGGPDGFDRVFQMVERSCRVLLESLNERPR